MKKILVVLFVLGLLLVACGNETQECQENKGGVLLWDTGLGWVTRHIDEDANVVCWIFSGGYKGGIYCLPLSETTLDR